MICSHLHKQTCGDISMKTVTAGNRGGGGEGERDREGEADLATLLAFCFSSIIWPFSSVFFLL